jgi:Tol biopolymer transport system component
MGEVYRATDSKLRRDVAIKVLPAAFIADRDRLARFEREAQLLAQLHHPRIASIFGLEESGGVRALVMELVEGPTLQEKLGAGALPLEEAVAIARQIAEALEAAHEKGIVHRDLKPQNVKIAADGSVKVLDFGLAKAMDPAASQAASPAASPTLMHSPTLTAVGTQLGVILGTAAYMAPEQARGVAVDKRADIWAFGVVLHEMLTGRRLFEGELVTDVLADVLRRPIDSAALPAATPAAVRQLVRRCLERNPKNRLHDIADARIVLDEVASGRQGEVEPAVAIAAPAPRSAVARWLPWTIAALATLAAAAIAFVVGRAPRGEPAPVVRFHVAPPESSTPTRRGSGFALSPDGRFLAMTGAGELWIRPLDSVSARRLEGIEDATYPFWSPDSEWLGFFADSQLMKVARTGGRPQKICDAAEGRGGTWGPGGMIVFSDRYGSHGLSRISAQGGERVAVTSTPGPESNHYHRYPQFFPDGRSFLYQHLAPTAEDAGVYVSSLDGGAPQRVLDGAEQGLYAPPASGAAEGHLLFRRDQALMAQPFDAGARRTVGEAALLAEGVGGGLNTGAGAFSISANGALAHSDTEERTGELVWVDRSGKRLAVANAETRELTGISLARGGRRLAIGAYATALVSDIWIQSLPGGEPSRFTFSSKWGWGSPLWSPDGSELVFATQDFVGLPGYEIRRRRADRTGAEETLLTSSTTIYPWDWSPDGRFLLYGDEKADLWLLPLAGDHKPSPFLVAPGLQHYGQFSPDGRHVAYVSNEQGRFEVFVGTNPPTGAPWQISAGGGTMPRWRRDGRELYFRTPDGTLMAVDLAAGVDDHAAPRRLFSGIPSPGNTSIFTYAAADDGQRFLLAASRSGAQPPIVVVLHWQAALGQNAASSGGPRP